MSALPGPPEPLSGGGVSLPLEPKGEANRVVAERDARVDAAKGIGIALVVIGHAKGASALYTILTSALTMPLFFFVSGWLSMQGRQAQQGILQRQRQLVSSLLVPYVFFFLCSYAYWLLTRNVGEKAARWGGLPWWDPLKGLFSGLGPDLYVNVAIWFLPALFTTTFFFNLGRRWLPISVLLMVAAAVAAAWAAVAPLSHRLPWGLDVAPVSLFFYVAGAAFRQWGLLRPGKLFCWVLLVTAAPLWVWLSFHNGRVDFNLQGFGRHPILLIGAGLCGIVVVMCQGELLKGMETLTWLGRNTLVVLCTHIVVLMVTSGVASVMKLSGGHHGMGWAVSVAFIALLASWPIQWCLARFAPWAIAAKTLPRSSTRPA
jgi:acyltransferase